LTVPCSEAGTRPAIDEQVSSITNRSMPGSEAGMMLAVDLPGFTPSRPPFLHLSGDGVKREAL
jgi:hypothetical protein